MKTTLTIIRWALGIFLCLLSIGGFAAGDTGLAIFILLLGVILLPLVTSVFLKPKPKLVVTSGYQTTEITQSVSLLNTSQADKPKSNWFRNWFTGWGTAIKVAHALDISIKKFPDIDPEKIETLLKIKEKWSDKETEFIRQRIIDGYDKKVSPDNVDILGRKYLDFYKTIFPTFDGQEIIQKINVNRVESFIFTKIKDDEVLDQMK